MQLGNVLGLDTKEMIEVWNEVSYLSKEDYNNFNDYFVSKVQFNESDLETDEELTVYEGMEMF